MSAISPVIATMTTDLITQIVLIVTTLAALVGVSILVAYGFRKLRSIGSK